MWELVHPSEESGPQYKGKKDKEQKAKDNPADVSHEDVCSIAPDETDHEMPELVSMIASHLVYASSIAGKTQEETKSVAVSLSDFGERKDASQNPEVAFGLDGGLPRDDVRSGSLHDGLDGRQPEGRRDEQPKASGPGGHRTRRTGEEAGRAELEKRIKDQLKETESTTEQPKLKEEEPRVVRPRPTEKGCTGLTIRSLMHLLPGASVIFASKSPAPAPQQWRHRCRQREHVTRSLIFLCHRFSIVIEADCILRLMQRSDRLTHLPQRRRPHRRVRRRLRGLRRRLLPRNRG